MRPLPSGGESGVAKRMRNPGVIEESRSRTMEIHVFVNNQQMGPYPKETVIQMAWLGSAFACFNAWKAAAN
jgi:hypothetical protein